MELPLGTKPRSCEVRTEQTIVSPITEDKEILCEV